MAVATILLMDLLLFLPSFGNFFCGDSLYFLSRHGDELRQPVRLLTGLDTLHSYRPLTHLVFDYLMYPLSGLDPRGYQVMTRGLHLAAACLVFLLLRRLTRSLGAALLGLFFFSVHAENFYLNYDPSFLPDILVGLTGVASLLAYASGRRWTSTLFFGLALLSKESAIMLPVGLLVVGLVSRREGRLPLAGALRGQLLALAPHLCLAAGYLLVQIVLRRGNLFPAEPGPYSLSLTWWTLWLKTKYLAWLFNIPADWERRRWWLLPPLLLVLTPLVWLLGSLRSAWRRNAQPLLLCTVWALVSLAPVLLISQVPMKHNLQFSVLALAVALTVSLDGGTTGERLLPGSVWWLIVPMALSTAFQVRNDLRFSWVAEGSGVAERSLAAVREAYPRLPKSAVLYLLPAPTRGNISWYFDGGSLFRLFYADPTLEMRFDSLERSLTTAVVQRSDVFFFRFVDGDRLYDVTQAFRRAQSDPTADNLLARFDPGLSSSSFQWNSRDLPRGGPVSVEDHVAGDVLRPSLLMLPGTSARFSLESLPPNPVLLVGATLGGKTRNGCSGKIVLSTDGRNEALEAVHLDQANSGVWWDGALDLSHLAGLRGALVLENDSGHEGDWIAWSRLRIVSRVGPSYAFEEEGAQPLAFLGASLFSRFSEAQVSPGFPWQPGDLLGAGVATFYTLERRGDTRLALTMLPGTTVGFPQTTLAPGAKLRFALTLSGGHSGGARARVSLHGTKGTRTVFETVLDNSFDGDVWRPEEVDLGAFAGDTVSLAIENAADRIAAPLAWGSLALVSGGGTSPPKTVEWRLLERAESAPVDFDRSEVYPDYEHFDTPNGKPVFLQWTSQARPYRLNLVTAAGARVRFAVPALPSGAVLQVSATHGASLGDGALGRLYWEQDGHRELLFERMVYPRQTYWIDQDISLARWAGQAGVLCFEASSGPKHNTVGDWISWGRMRIVGGK